MPVFGDGSRWCEETMTQHKTKIKQSKPQFSNSLFNLSQKYLGLFRSIVKSKIEYPLPTYFLLFHSIELTLKSFLAAKGLDEDTLKKTSHKLVDIFQLCKENNLPYVEQLDKLIDFLFEMNSVNDFRYPSEFNLSLPHSNECLAIMEVFVKKVGPIINHAGWVEFVAEHNKSFLNVEQAPTNT